MTENKSQWEKVKTMHFLASVLIIGFVATYIYQTVEIGILLNKKILQSDDYSALAKDLNRNVKELVMIVITYFFGREVGKKEQSE